MPRWCDEIQNIKNKETTSKSSRKKEIAYKSMISATAIDFSAATRDFRRQWSNIFKVNEGKDITLRDFKAIKLSIKTENNEPQRQTSHETTSKQQAKYLTFLQRRNTNGQLAHEKILSIINN